MKNNSKTPMLIRRIILLLIDSLSIFVSFYASFMIFYNSLLSMQFITHVLPEAVSLWIVTMGIFIFFKLYTSLWQFASVTELMNIILATFNVPKTLFLIASCGASSINGTCLCAAA